MPLVQETTVLQSVRDGGHSPVIFELRLDSPLVLSWQRPSPRLPLLLGRSSVELGQSADWLSLVQRWLEAAVVQKALDPTVPHTGTSLSKALVAALDCLVSLAGGWVLRPRVRRAAYDSHALRVARRVLVDIYGFARLLRQVLDAGPAPWPRAVAQLRVRLQQAGVHLPDGSAAVLLPLVEKAASDQRAVIQTITKSLRRERHDRWAKSLPTLWRSALGLCIIGCRVSVLLGAPSQCWIQQACSVPPRLQWTLQFAAIGLTRCCAVMLMWMLLQAGLPSWRPPLRPTYRPCSGQLLLGQQIGSSRFSAR
jgi:hypothetical protein